VRRTVATLLVVASSFLMVAPVGAAEAGPGGPAALPAAPPVVHAPAAPALDVAVAPPAAPAPAPAVRAPAVPAPARATTAVPAVATARPALKAVRTKAARTAAGVSDTAYAARLQVELCRARAIFCGLDHGGRYPGR
jgi:hypothetical protein